MMQYSFVTVNQVDKEIYMPKEILLLDEIDERIAKLEKAVQEDTQNAKDIIALLSKIKLTDKCLDEVDRLLVATVKDPDWHQLEVDALMGVIHMTGVDQLLKPPKKGM
jgi:hypothetical protein